jgi:hypothetical protein
VFGTVSANPFSIEAAVSSRQQHSENWIDEARRRLANWRGKKPETKAGQIWALWPEIKAALDDGQSIKSIRLWLEDQVGIVVTTDSLRTYIRRCRAKETARQELDHPTGLDLRAGRTNQNRATRPLRTAFPIPTVPSQTSPETRDKGDVTDDPMAIARKALDKPRFDIRKIHGDGDPSDRKLI